MERMYLVQAGKLKKEIDNSKEIIGFSHIANLKYMGAAEFECELGYNNGLTNPLHNSLVRMVKNRADYDFVCNARMKKDVYGNKLYVYCKKDDYNEAIEAIKKLAKNEYCKRYTGFSTYTNRTVEELENNPDKYMDFWWDIKNDIVFFYGDETVEKVNMVLDALHEAWKEEFFPPQKVSWFKRITNLFSKKEMV